MFNFDETRNLGELKELSFYIKAINESGYANSWSRDLDKILAYLKKEYNLEVPASKLYLFVQKIVHLFNNGDKFPKSEEVDEIVKSYIKFVRDDIAKAEFDVVKAGLKFKEPKHKTIDNQYSSSEQLVDGVELKRKLYNKKITSMLIWSAVIALFLSSLTYCVVGVVLPSIFSTMENVSRVVVLFLALFVILFGIIFEINYLSNKKYLTPLKDAVWNYDAYETAIIYDVQSLSQARHKLSLLEDRFSINGIEMTDETIYKFLSSSDSIDVKFYNKKLSGSSEILKQEDRKPTLKSIGQVLSRREQNMAWFDSESAKHEKLLMNNEMVARITNLANFLKSKNLSDINLASEISELYCKELSISSRKTKIDEAKSKIELNINYIAMVDKILEFEKINLFEGARVSSELKSAEIATKEEKQYFIKSISDSFKRIEKATALGLLTSGQEKSYMSLYKNFKQGLIQGVDLNSIEFRYDLAKLYVKIYDELSIYDLLS